MGTFHGHVTIGLLLIVVSLWGLLSSLPKYYDFHRRRRQRRQKSYESDKNSTITSSSHGPPEHFVNTSSSRTTIRCLNLVNYPLESWIRILGILIAVGMEFTAFLGEDAETAEGFHGSLENKQHMIMYFFFVFGSIFDLLYHYRVALPGRKLDYVTIALAFLVEYVSMLWHLDGRNNLNVTLHKLATYSIGAGVIIVILEMFLEKEYTVQIIRHGIVMLQGSWFVHVGFILFGPLGTSWNVEFIDKISKHMGMTVCILYMSHILLITFLFIAVGAYFSIRYHRSINDNWSTQYSKLEALLEDE